MQYDIAVSLWGPQKGSALMRAGNMGETLEGVGLLAQAGLTHLPDTWILRVEMGEESRLIEGQVTAGYWISMTVAAIRETGAVERGELEILRCQIESGVSVALLELLQPIIVDKVTVTQAA